jgi:glutamine synthetase
VYFKAFGENALVFELYFWVEVGANGIGASVASDLRFLIARALAEHGIALLPQTLGDALDALEADPVIRDGIGDALAVEFIRLKRMEWIEYCRHVSEWERERYVEFF